MPPLTWRRSMPSISSATTFKRSKYQRQFINCWRDRQSGRCMMNWTRTYWSGGSRCCSAWSPITAPPSISSAYGNPTPSFSTSSFATSSNSSSQSIPIRVISLTFSFSSKSMPLTWCIWTCPTWRKDAIVFDPYASATSPNSKFSICNITMTSSRITNRALRPTSHFLRSLRSPTMLMYWIVTLGGSKCKVQQSSGNRKQEA